MSLLMLIIARVYAPLGALGALVEGALAARHDLNSLAA